MTIDLKPEQQRVIELAVGSGAYRNPDEVLDQAFEIIREQLDLQGWMFERREAIAAHIEKSAHPAHSFLSDPPPSPDGGLGSAGFDPASLRMPAMSRASRIRPPILERLPPSTPMSARSESISGACTR